MQNRFRKVIFHTIQHYTQNLCSVCECAVNFVCFAVRQSIFWQIFQKIFLSQRLFYILSHHWQAIDDIKKVIKGKDESLNKLMCTMLAGGHILMEDIPGVGKTTLALAFSKALSLKQKRMQFTPDVLPSDVCGYHMYQKDTGKFVYYPGAVMCNLFLADEINRTSPKTQSALLEVMEEGTVTKWVKQEGDTVKAGDVILEITTDKLTSAGGRIFGDVN